MPDAASGVSEQVALVGKCDIEPEAVPGADEVFQHVGKMVYIDDCPGETCFAQPQHQPFYQGTPS